MSKSAKNSRDNNDIAHGVDFFQALNYGGDPIHYDEAAEQISVPQADNDTYLSADIGTNSKLYAWQHYDGTGQHHEWTEDQPDLTNMGGISLFRVAANNTNGVWVRLQSNVNDDKTYTLYIHVSEDIGESTVSSENEAYSLVGIIPDNGQPHTTQISVRDPDGVYVANGSCYFKSFGSDIILEPGPNFPSNMSFTEDEERFTFILNTPASDAS